MDSFVLWLQCGKATADFVRSEHRGFVAELWNDGSRSLDLFFLVLVVAKFFSYSVHSNIFRKSLAMEPFLFLWSTALALEHLKHKQCFFVHISLFFEARLKPIAAAVAWIPKSTALEYLLCL